MVSISGHGPSVTIHIWKQSYSKTIMIKFDVSNLNAGDIIIHSEAKNGWDVGHSLPLSGYLHLLSLRSTVEFNVREI